MRFDAPHSGISHLLERNFTEMPAHCVVAMDTRPPVQFRCQRFATNLQVRNRPFVAILVLLRKSPPVLHSHLAPETRLPSTLYWHASWSSLPPRLKTLPLQLSRRLELDELSDAPHPSPQQAFC